MTSSPGGRGLEDDRMRCDSDIRKVFLFGRVGPIAHLPAGVLSPICSAEQRSGSAVVPRNVLKTTRRHVSFERISQLRENSAEADKICPSAPLELGS